MSAPGSGALMWCGNGSDLMERRSRSVNIRAWPRVRGIVTCQLRLDTQQLNHQSNLVFNGFGHVCSYQHHIGGELLPVTMQTGAPLPLYYLHKTKHKQRKTLNSPLGMSSWGGWILVCLTFPGFPSSEWWEMVNKSTWLCCKHKGP